MKMNGYYTEKLSAGHLKRCYEIAPPRVRQYLKAEIRHVLSKISPGDIVLELGCGYGRVIETICAGAMVAIGIDISGESLELGGKLLKGASNYRLFQMNAVSLEFPDHFFDVVICVQNGISVFHVNKIDLIREAVRVTRREGTVLFSSYSDKFWKDRLEWFYLQSEEGLLGEIDQDATGNGVIVCKDGFRATTVGPDKFISLTSGLGIKPKIEEVDNSSIFCEISVT